MASLAAGAESGWESLVLESDRLRAVVLPAKGAEIHRLVDVATGVDVLFRGPWGLQPPGALPLAGSGDDEFMWNYAGGWQQLFPSVNEACAYRGRRMPFHGEVASLPWKHEVVAAAGREVAVRLTARCRMTPFLVERVLRLRDGEPELVVEGTVTNTSTGPAHFVWGEHCVVGAPLLEAGSRLELPARTIVTRPELWEPETAALAPGQREAWPLARLRDGSRVDLRAIPGAEARTHDDLYVTDLDATWLSVHNPRLQLTFRLDWDQPAFAWVVLWQAYGGADAPPLTGSYALGLEPWTSRLNLEDAVAAGEAIELEPGAQFQARLRARVEHDEIWPSVPDELVGAPSREEQDAILGYGPEGV